MRSWVLVLCLIGIVAMIGVGTGCQPVHKSADDVYKALKAAMDRKDYDAALRLADDGCERFPDHLGIRFLRGITHQLMSHHAKAIDDYSAVLALLQAKTGNTPHPLAANVHFFRAKAFYENKQWKAAIDALSRTHALYPNDSRIANYLAWALATVPEETLRDPGQSRRLAGSLCKKTKWKVATHIDTLAAAQASAGEYDMAETTLGKALAITTDPAHRARYQSRMELYRSGKPFVAGK